jgi:hypothetical protein
VKIYNTSNDLILEIPGESLQQAYLQDADLRGADLRYADLRGAYLQGANLQDADLRGADLRYADLRGADLRGANLWGADLQEADLQEADLREADLREANLRNTRYNHSTIGVHRAPSGCLLGWKKLDGRYLISLRIPSKARRSCATTRKHRAEYARVLRIVDIDSGVELEEVLGGLCPTRYKVGELVYPNRWDTDRWNECSNGIHFFLTEAEAMAWGST